MAKIKLTRNELKAQREALTRYTRFLPTLELKKLQLELERRKLEKELAALDEEKHEFRKQTAPWAKLFAETYPKPVPEMVRVREIKTRDINIAGLSIPRFEDISFDVEEYDLFLTAPWADAGVEAVQKTIRFRERLKILLKQQETILTELRKTTQRINLFKERLIPQCKENIRQIRIHLGDMQAAAVGRAKMAKQKLQKKA